MCWNPRTKEKNSSEKNTHDSVEKNISYNTNQKKARKSQKDKSARETNKHTDTHTRARCVQLMKNVRKSQNEKSIIAPCINEYSSKNIFYIFFSQSVDCVDALVSLSFSRMHKKTLTQTQNTHLKSGDTKNAFSTYAIVDKGKNVRCVRSSHNRFFQRRNE